MPKNQYIDPKTMRESGWIEFDKIPVNQYQKKVSEEVDNFSKEDLIGIYRDMRYIREFETMLNLFKTTGAYNGIEYNHPGPAHLSIGQESAAVGQAFHLDENDFIFGSHRSHGEIMAKGFSAIKKMDNTKLYGVMKDYFDGSILKVVEDNCKNTGEKDMALDFLLYGTLAEIFARDTGFNRGLGGSMHTFFTPFGIYPNNAIVGGSAGIAMGAALYKKTNKKDGIVIANLGDASLGCGPVYEAFNFAAMDQLKELWEEGYRGGLPIIFNVFNNSYGMGGQTKGETMAYDMLARLGAGITPDQMHAERVDGFNPLAVIEAMSRKKQLITAKSDGPVLLDVVTYRFSGHSPSDASSYRSKDEVDAWQKMDPIKAYASELIEAGVLSSDDIAAIDEEIVNRTSNVVKMATNDDISPRMNLDTAPDTIADLMFSNQSVEKMDDRKPEVLIADMQDNPRVKQLKSKERFGIKDGKPVSKIKSFQFRDAVFESVIEKFYTDPTLIAYGEDVRDWGGAYAVYRGLTESLPYNRFFNSPISEAAIVASAVGYALCGGRVLVELMYCDFLGRAGDEIFNQMAKWQAMSAGVLKMPLVLRVSVGSKYGAQHSQDWTSLCAHVPGLKVVFPVTPYDAKGIMNSALNGTDPVIFFESQRCYDVAETFHEGGVPTDYYEIEIGDPDVKRQGDDITIITIGATLFKALEAADTLQEKYGISAEVIDARSIVPFNYEKIIKSVKKTGRVVLASDACERNSYLKNIAQGITEMAFDYLDAPPAVVGAQNWITPAHELEKYFFPQPSWILDAINEKILPLEGYVSERNYTTQEQIRLNKKGV